MRQVDSCLGGRLGRLGQKRGHLVEGVSKGREGERRVTGCVRHRGFEAVEVLGYGTIIDIRQPDEAGGVGFQNFVSALYGGVIVPALEDDWPGDGRFLPSEFPRAVPTLVPGGLSGGLGGERVKGLCSGASDSVNG